MMKKRQEIRQKDGEPVVNRLFKKACLLRLDLD